MTVTFLDNMLDQQLSYIPSSEFACIEFEGFRKLAIDFDKLEVRAVDDTDTIMSMFEERAITLLTPDEPPLVAVDQHQQNTDNDDVDRHRNKEMFGPLLNFPTRLSVFRTGIRPVNPGIKRRPQDLLPGRNHDHGQRRSEHSKEND